MNTQVLVALLLVTAFATGVIAADPPRPPAVVTLLEDDADVLLQRLHGGPGVGQVEKTIVFSGRESIKITPMQRFERAIPGWKYRIAKEPEPGEYRYLRFAWKADGCTGIMVQLHDETDWNIRYTAGRDVQNWGTKYVASAPPAEWTVVTCDLFQDLGGRTIQGIALTAFDGNAGYFDHIYLGRTIEDLDCIDATGMRTKSLVLQAGDAERLWRDLVANDAAAAYLAFWSLVASPAQSVPFLREKLRMPLPEDAIRIRQMIQELGDDNYQVRQRATQRLADCIDTALPLLEKEMAITPSAEVRARLNRLLESRVAERARRWKAIRVLENASTATARVCLEDITKGADPRLAEAARSALRRLANDQHK